MKLMKAVRIHGYGGPEVLQYEEAPAPTIGDKEVLIRVHAAAVNPLDWKVRSGSAVAWYHHNFPLILGFDVAGVIEAVGADVKHFVPGDEVYASPDPGGYAEYVAMSAYEVAHKPRSLDFVQAAAMPIAALTAWQGLFEAAHLVAGQTVLIHGAAGSVGSFAVQLAKWRGARVIGTASGYNHAFLRELGADEAIDYTTMCFETVVDQVDVVFDTIGGETQQRSLAIMKRGGQLVALMHDFAPELAAAQGIQQHNLGVQVNANQLATLARIVDAGQLKPIVSTVLPLQDVCLAHVLSERRHTRGKIVLSVVA